MDPVLHPLPGGRRPWRGECSRKYQPTFTGRGVTTAKHFATAASPRDREYLKVDFELVLNFDDTASDLDGLNSKIGLLDADRANIGVIFTSDVEDHRSGGPMQGQIARHSPGVVSGQPDVARFENDLRIRG